MIKSVLTVDDSEADQLLTRMAIESYDPDIKILQAYDGREALDVLAAEASPPDAILLDIDHSPTEFLTPSNAGFYTTENLARMADQLKPKGVFAMWSQNPPEENFEALLKTVFETVDSHLVSFPNPFQGKDSTNSVYVCIKK